MKNLLLLTSVLCLIAYPVLTGAQKETGQEPASQKPPVAVTEAYRLAAEDVIAINVINFTNLTLPSVVIPPDGRISVPLLDPLQVTGLTVDELRDLLIQKWRKYVINPSVTVSLSQKRR